MICVGIERPAERSEAKTVQWTVFGRWKFPYRSYTPLLTFRKQFKNLTQTTGYYNTAIT